MTHIDEVTFGKSITPRRKAKVVPIHGRPQGTARLRRRGSSGAGPLDFAQSQPQGATESQARTAIVTFKKTLMVIYEKMLRLARIATKSVERVQTT